MPRSRKGRPSVVGPRVQVVTTEYRKYDGNDADLRSNEVQTLISELFLLARKKGRPKKEMEVEKYAA